MEQWKQAKKLRCSRIAERFPMDMFLHFKKIRIDNFKFCDGNLIMIRDVLLKSTHLGSGYFGIQHMFYNIYNEAPAPVDMEKNEKKMDRIMSENPGYNSRTGRFPIPNSRHYFQLKIEGDGKKFLSIRRI